MLPPDASATEALENGVEESRREYDKKVETMEEIDDKAMRSVRTAVILVGLVVAAVSVSGPRAVGETAVLPVLVGAFGVGTLTVSVVYGIGACTVTQYPTGISSTHRNDVVEGEYSLRYLEIAQTSSLFGVVALLVSASTIVVKTAYEIRPLVTITVVLVALVAVRTYLGNKD